MRVRSWFPVVALAALTWTAMPVAAQTAPDERAERNRLEERIRARVGQIIRERLELNDAEAARLSEISREFEGRRRELYRSEQDTRRRVEALVESSTPDETEAVRLLDRMIALEREQADLFREEQVRLREMLSASQVLELHRLRIELGRRIRALRDNNDGRGRRSGPGDGQDDRGGSGLVLER